MQKAIDQTHFVLPGVEKVYRGKVRDIYYREKELIMVATDRISAFDSILPAPIPFKGQVLNTIAAEMLSSTADIVPNWLKKVPHPNVSMGLNCDPIPLEMVVRGYLVGHAWRVYRSGERTLCGIHLPDGMTENQAFSSPIITPATKAEEGHDMDISEEEILAQGIVNQNAWQELKRISLELYKRGSEIADRQGLILVDSKYEFGMYEGQILLIDEVHTPDSSRYFYKEEYPDRLNAGIAQRHLSKEFVREWLISEGFQGLDGQQMPDMTPSRILDISQRYLELFETLMGRSLEKVDTNLIEEKILQALD